MDEANLNSNLFEAVETNNLDAVKYYVHTEGVNVNKFNACGKTPLHITAIKGFTEVAAELLEKGADINMLTKKGRASLFLAAQHGNYDVLKLLLKKPNLNVNLYHEGQTPLYVACKNGHTDVVQVLLADHRCMHYINIDCKHTKPLHVAAKYGYEDIISRLLEKKPSVNAIDNNGCPPLWVALDNNQVGSVRALLKDFRVNVNFRFQESTPLEYAIRERNATVCILLLERGAEINVTDNEGLTLLHHVVDKGLLDVVDYLLIRGASVHSKTNRGNTPLHIAAMSGELEIAKLLIDKGADAYVSSENYHRDTPLQLAIKNGHLKMAKFLIEKGADVNATDSHSHYALDRGGTLLHWAAREDDPKFQDEVIRFLVENGADVNATAYDGRTPLCLLVKHHFHSRSLDIMRYLIEKGANLNNQHGGSPLFWAFYIDYSGNYPEVANFLIEMGTDINQPMRYFRNPSDRMETPLHLAKNISTVKLLIEKGADIHATDKWGNTPLHLVHNLPKAKYLVQKGANVNARNESGDTPLHYVQNAYIAKFLIKVGADVKATNRKGYTPLHVALNTSIAELLIENGANLRARAENGKTVLHTAAEGDVILNAKYNSLPDLVYFFIQNGMDVNIVDDDGNTPLHICGKTNNSGIAPRLLENGANRNLINNSNLKPVECGENYDGGGGMFVSMLKSIDKLFSAIENDETVDFIRRLISNLRTINVLKDESKITPLHYAVQLRRKKIVKFFLEGKWPVRCGKTFKYRNKFIDSILRKVDVNALCKDNWTPLHYAARGGDLNIVSLLLKSGAAHSVKTNKGQLPVELAENSSVRQLFALVTKVFEATKVGNLEQIIEYIKKEGSIINAVENDGSSLLHRAISSGYKDIATFLLESGVDVTQITNEGSTTLHLAVFENDTELVDTILGYLIQTGRLNSFVNAKKTNGNSALHIAAQIGSLGITKTLLKHGVAFNVQNKDSLKPADTTSSGKVTNFLKLVEEVFEIAEENNPEILKRLEEIDADDFIILANALNSYGHTLADILKFNDCHSVVVRLSEMKSSREKELLSQNQRNNFANKSCVQENMEDEDMGFGLFDR